MPIRNLVFMPRRTSWGLQCRLLIVYFGQFLVHEFCTWTYGSEQRNFKLNLPWNDISHSLQTSYKRVLARTDWLTDVFSSESDRQVERAESRRQKSNGASRGSRGKENKEGICFRDAALKKRDRSPAQSVEILSWYGIMGWGHLGHFLKWPKWSF